MKKIILPLIFTASVWSCKEAISLKDYAVFGDTIPTETVLSQAEMLEKYKTLKEGDTLNVTFSSKINDVCQKKGCWMNLALNEKEDTFVKFKDYAFFVPLNAANSETIVSGKAFISVVPVADLKHFAEDAGEPQSVIDTITKPEVTYSFMADGVLIKK